MIFGIGGHPGFKIDLNQEDYYFELDALEEEMEALKAEKDSQLEALKAEQQNTEAQLEESKLWN